MLYGTFGYILSLAIEDYKGDITHTYIDGGAILLGIFIADRIFWGFLWFTRAKTREGLRRAIVERQLEQIRAQEQA